MGEGDTPLVAAPKLGAQVGAEVYLKIEGANPTGSFKDRGMTCAVSDAVRSGAEAVWLPPAPGPESVISVIAGDSIVTALYEPETGDSGWPA